MSRFLILSILAVGCAKSSSTPPTVASAPTVPVAAPVAAVPVDDGFTSDADLVRFKDKPGEFVGKTLKVRAQYFNPFPNLRPSPLGSHKPGEPFIKIVTHNNSPVEIRFLFDLTNVGKVPNGSVGESFTVEFEVVEVVAKPVNVTKNKAKSISR